MRAVPEGLDERDLLDALREGWGLSPTSAEYAPVGGGSYHWRVNDRAGVRHWVTVDDLDSKGFLGGSRDAVFDGLRRAFDSACALRAAGLEFVVAPVPSSRGDSVLRLGDRHALALFPYLDRAAGQFGQARTAGERAAVVDALVRLHQTSADPARTSADPARTSADPARTAVNPARVADATVPYRTGLERALAELDRPWSGGPYAERARARLAECAPAVRRFLERFDRLARRPRGEPVLTHGEPHPGNVVFGDGRILLVDWDTVALAPPERDLWMLDTDDLLARYAEASGRPVDRAAIELYRLRWKLDDIAWFVQLLRSPHDDNADTARTWSWAVESFEAEVRPYGSTVDG